MFLSSFRSSEILFHEVILSVYLQTFVRHSIFIFQNANIYSYLIFKKKKNIGVPQPYWHLPLLTNI